MVAAGAIVRGPHPLVRASLRVEHWSNAVEQGKAAAKTLLRGDDAEPFLGIPSFWSDHFGLRLQSVGALRLATRYDVVQEDLESGEFAAFAFDEDDRLVGGVTYGIPRSMAECRARLAQAAVEVARAL
jgi:NADPH-dependent 2,4-dienoyl-CoA reductase/sulfur reductase-like enzyme